MAEFENAPLDERKLARRMNDKLAGSGRRLDYVNPSGHWRLLDHEGGSRIIHDLTEFAGEYGVEA